MGQKDQLVRKRLMRRHQIRSQAQWPHSSSGNIRWQHSHSYLVGCQQPYKSIGEDHQCRQWLWRVQLPHLEPCLRRAQRPDSRMLNPKVFADDNEST